MRVKGVPSRFPLPTRSRYSVSKWKANQECQRIAFSIRALSEMQMREVY